MRVIFRLFPEFEKNVAKQWAAGGRFNLRDSSEEDAGR